MNEPSLLTGGRGIAIDDQGDKRLVGSKVRCKVSIILLRILAWGFDTSGVSGSTPQRIC